MQQPVPVARVCRVLGEEAEVEVRDFVAGAAECDVAEMHGFGFVAEIWRGGGFGVVA